MGNGQFGLEEAVSIALGSMIGGGIYAVLGVVTQITEAATWFAFLLAGAVAICAGYSYIGLNQVVADRGSDGGGAVTFVQSFTGNSTLAGMIGWTLLIGYVGSMAMYAFAFGEFTITFPYIPQSVAGIPLRPVISVLAVAGFVGLNLVGAWATGSAENALVAAKILVLLVFGVGGMLYAASTRIGPLARQEDEEDDRRDEDEQFAEDFDVDEERSKRCRLLNEVSMDGPLTTQADQGEDTPEDHPDERVFPVPSPL